jgi:hypothetical protein
MNKPRLLKKDSIPQELISRRRKAPRARKAKPPAARAAAEVATEWINHQRKERPSAREAFAALFVEPDPQSA